MQRWIEADLTKLSRCATEKDADADTNAEDLGLSKAGSIVQCFRACS